MQRFAEELFKRLNKSSGERFEVRLAMMSVVSRVTGVHKLLLLNFYPFLQRYILPHQREAPSLLAIMVQARPPTPTLGARSLRQAEQKVACLAALSSRIKSCLAPQRLWPLHRCGRCINQLVLPHASTAQGPA